MTSFRPLALFWAGLLCLFTGAAVTLQVLGPLPPRTAPPASPGPVSLARPARALPSRADPAPALKMASASIPEPDPALLEPAPGLPGRMLPRPGGSGRLAAGLAFAAMQRRRRRFVALSGRHRAAPDARGAGLAQAAE